MKISDFVKFGRKWSNLEEYRWTEKYIILI